MLARKLKYKTILEITPTKPFHFDSTFFKPGHFPSSDTKWESGKRWQTTLWQNLNLGIIYKDAGSRQNPKVEVTIFSDEKLDGGFLSSLKEEVVWRFNLDLDLSEFYRDVSNDPQLKPIIKKFFGLRPMHYGSLYEYLIIDIVLQNATVRRSVSMLQSLFEKYGTLVEFNNQQFWCYWLPKRVKKDDEQKLRELKLGYRAESIVRVSLPFISGEINEFDLRTKNADEQEKVLLSLYGIGPASAGYIMLDVFHRWDFLKHISPWEQKIYTKIFFNEDYERNLVPVEKMLDYFEKWGKWKALAVHYAWENTWWKRRNEHVPWLEKLIRL